MTIGKTRERTGRTPSAILICSQEDEFDNDVYHLVSSKSFSGTAGNNVILDIEVLQTSKTVVDEIHIHTKK